MDRNRTNRSGIAAILVLAGSLLASGCSQEEKRQEYSIPEEICGIRVDPSLSEAVFPPGSDFSMDANDSMEGRLLCTIYIDSKRTADFSTYMLETLSEPPGPPFDDSGALLETINIEGEALLWEQGAGISFRCLADDESLYAYPKISINFFDTPIDDDQERKDAIEAFARSYVEGVKEYQQCDDV
ncbi:hypothetical protein ACFV5N_24305 [Streptomyces sp. NPDC059853]|uniref:hypothetical protein n=1 Tax=Streptomyces sp. NPDC059853 TaxID=3346973 RepID=UPI003651DDE0